MSTTQKTLTRHLTHDELVHFRSGILGIACPFRVRIWQGLEQTTVVLVSRHHDDYIWGDYPGEYSETIANHVHEAILRFPATGILYFETAPGGKDGDLLVECNFTYFGCWQRCRLYSPVKRPVCWESLEASLMCPIER